jgi:hypothetical protein
MKNNHSFGLAIIALVSIAHVEIGRCTRICTSSLTVVISESEISAVLSKRGLDDLDIKTKISGLLAYVLKTHNPTQDEFEYLVLGAKAEYLESPKSHASSINTRAAISTSINEAMQELVDLVNFEEQCIDSKDAYPPNERGMQFNQIPGECNPSKCRLLVSCDDCGTNSYT